MLGEYDSSGNPITELIWLGDTPVAIKGIMPCLTSTSGTNGVPSCTENAIAYVWSDHLNTPRELTRVNTANNLHVSLWKWDSLPFGETQPNANPSSLGIMTFNHRFPGQYYDKETGLHQNWHREYDAKIGRYITSDPIGLAAGTNTFLYGLANPIEKTDVKGEDALDPAALFCTSACSADPWSTASKLRMADPLNSALRNNENWWTAYDAANEYGSPAAGAMTCGWSAIKALRRLLGDETTSPLSLSALLAGLSGSNSGGLGGIPITAIRSACGC